MGCICHITIFISVEVCVWPVGLFLLCVVSSLCYAKMACWVALLGTRVVYISGVALLVFATTTSSVSESVITVTVMVALTGYTLSVLQVIPYTLVCLYHSHGHVNESPNHTLQFYA